MAGSVNKVILIGNLGKDPEVRHFDDGGSLARFPLATTETYRNRDGEKISNTEWHNVILRRGLAQLAENYLKVGDRVYIEGSIRTRKWQDDQQNDRYSTEIIGNNLVMLGGRRDEEGSSMSNQTQSGKTEGTNPSSGTDTSLQNDEMDDAGLPF
jgi:single-strand DNA-binding protein